MKKYLFGLGAMLVDRDRQGGGRTKEEAAKHWELLSNLLRGIRKEIRAISD